MKKQYSVKITPAILPKERHQLEKVIEKLGYKVWAGGTNTDMSQCDFSFEKGGETK